MSPPCYARFSTYVTRDRWSSPFDNRRRSRRARRSAAANDNRLLSSLSLSSTSETRRDTSWSTRPPPPSWPSRASWPPYGVPYTRIAWTSTRWWCPTSGPKRWVGHTTHTHIRQIRVDPILRPTLAPARTENTDRISLNTLCTRFDYLRFCRVLARIILLLLLYPSPQPIARRTNLPVEIRFYREFYMEFPCRIFAMCPPPTPDSATSTGLRAVYLVAIITVILYSVIRTPGYLRPHDVKSSRAIRHWNVRVVTVVVVVVCRASREISDSPFSSRVFSEYLIFYHNHGTLPIFCINRRNFLRSASDVRDIAMWIHRTQLCGRMRLWQQYIHQTCIVRLACVMPLLLYKWQ